MRQRKVESDYQMVEISVSLKSRIYRNCQQRAAEITFWGFIIALQLCYKIFVKLEDYLRKYSPKFDRTCTVMLFRISYPPDNSIIHEILKSYRAALRYCVEETSLFTVKLYCDRLRNVRRSVFIIYIIF